VPYITNRLGWFAAIAPLVLGGIALLAWQAWQQLESDGFLQGVPPSIVIEKVVFANSTFGFREGCGSGIFKMAEHSAAAIEEQGLVYFREVKTGRDEGKYYRYGEWKETSPSAPEQNILRGLGSGCANVSEAISKVLWNAASHPGSYFAIGYEYDILVIPDLGWVVISTNG
jgi:hypothetical protein